MLLKNGIEGQVRTMPRYIDIDDDRNCYIGNDGEYERYNIDPDMLDEAVEIIHCKDCKHKYLDDMVWNCPFGLPGGEDFFCAYGVKDGDSDEE